MLSLTGEEVSARSQTLPALAVAKTQKSSLKAATGDTTGSKSKSKTRSGAQKCGSDGRCQRWGTNEKEEAGKELARLVRKVGHERSVRLLELAVSVKPKSAIEALEKMEPAGQKQAS